MRLGSGRGIQRYPPDMWVGCFALFRGISAGLYRRGVSQPLRGPMAGRARKAPDSTLSLPGRLAAIITGAQLPLPLPGILLPAVAKPLP